MKTAIANEYDGFDCPDCHIALEYGQKNGKGQCGCCGRYFRLELPDNKEDDRPGDNWPVTE